MSLIKCRECGAQVSEEAKKCPNCGAVPQKKMGLGMKVLLGFGAILVIGTMAGHSSGGATSAAQDGGGTAPATQAEVASLQAAALADGPLWSYEDGADKMRGTHWASATVDATEKLHFSFPYNGGSTPSLEVRQKGKQVDVILFVSKGQFLCHIDGCSVEVKFDDGAVSPYFAGEADDGETNLLFIEGAARFIAKLRKAKTVTIEAEFFQEGNRQMTFPVKGLRWPLA
ncbi:zinc ribbon domain-containing protein [Trinickia dabaoshanensis]|nr:zinc ribbon domain-containing protein [Trinickia dabaoshanensis]